MYPKMHAKSTLYHNFGIFDVNQHSVLSSNSFLCMAHKRKRVLVHIKCPLFMRARKKVSRQPCFWGFPACIKWAHERSQSSPLLICVPFFSHCCRRGFITETSWLSLLLSSFSCENNSLETRRETFLFPPCPMLLLLRQKRQMKRD